MQPKLFFVELIHLPFLSPIGTSHNHPSSRIPAYVIVLAVIIPICIITILILVTRYCVTHKRQRSVTLTMRRAQRMRRMEALHIDIEYSDSEALPSRCYTNLAIESSHDENNDISTTEEEQNNGQTDEISREKHNDHTMDDHVDDNKHSNQIASNTSDHVGTTINDSDHVDLYNATNDMHYHDHVEDHVSPFDESKPQPPTRFDFSDTESTTSAENWALVSASEMMFLTRNDVIMIVEGEEGGDEMSIKPIHMGNETTVVDHEEDKTPLSEINGHDDS